MNFKIVGYIFGVLLLLVLIGGVGYKLIAPTNKTVIGQGGKLITLNTEKPSFPLGGCSIYRVNLKAYWEKGFKLEDKK